MWGALQLFFQFRMMEGWTQRDTGTRPGLPIGSSEVWVHDQGPQRKRSMGELFLGERWRKILYFTFKESTSSFSPVNCSILGN